MHKHTRDEAVAILEAIKAAKDRFNFEPSKTTHNYLINLYAVLPVADVLELLKEQYEQAS
jgi:hypothetical protein